MHLLVRLTASGPVFGFCIKQKECQTLRELFWKLCQHVIHKLCKVLRLSCTLRGGDTLAERIDRDLSQFEAVVSVRDNLSEDFVALYRYRFGTTKPVIGQGGRSEFNQASGIFGSAKDKSNEPLVSFDQMLHGSKSGD